MNRKSLKASAIILVVLMLAQVILPFAEVTAATIVNASNADQLPEGYTSYIFNSELYKALKNALINGGYTAIYNDAQRTISTTDDEIAKIQRLDLTNYGIKSLEGLSIFTNVTYLDLSGNKLTSKDGHLEELNSFSLDYLDLSSNELDDVSMVPDIDSVQTLNLHNQKIKKVEFIYANTQDTETVVTTSYKTVLPEILLHGGQIEARWITTTTDNSNLSINWTEFDPTNIEIIVRSGDPNSGTVNEGMIKVAFVVNNPESRLYNSEINMYYVVCRADQRGIEFKDKNAYEIVKAQLEEDQDINENLFEYTDDETLYEKAYDEPYVLVIDLNTLINKINSLKLTNEEIEDLTGVDKFVGLERELDFSYNYIDTLDRVYDLKENKLTEEELLRQRVKNQLKEVEKYAKIIKQEYQIIENNEKAIEEAQKKIEAIEASDATPEAKASAIQAEQNKINQAQINIAEAEQIIEENRDLFEYEFEKLFDIYNKLSRFSRILTVDVQHYLNDELSLLDQTELAKVYKDQLSKMIKISENLKDYEKNILIDEFNMPRTKVVGTGESMHNETIADPVKEYFTELQKDDEVSRGSMLNLIRTLRQFDAIFEMASYCETKRIEANSTTCFAEEYLQNRIEDFTNSGDDFNKALYEAILANITSIKAELSAYGFNCEETPSYADEDAQLKARINMFYRINSADGKEFEEYVCLPKLECIDATNNLIPSIDDIDKLPELKKLYLNDNEIVDLSKVDWASMTNLVVLELDYNEISDIKPLEQLVNIQRLTLNKNLIKGKLDFIISRFRKLKTLELNYNAIDDIGTIKNQYEFIAKDHGYDSVNDYLYYDDEAVDIQLYGQILSMKLVLTDENGLTRVDLPPIFYQAEELDPKRTIFGVVSLYGNVTNRGKEVILETANPGVYAGQVYIKTNPNELQNGNSICSETICTINYKVTHVDTPVNNTVDNTTNNTVVNNTVDNTTNNTVVNNTVNNTTNNTVANNTVNNTVNPDPTKPLGYTTKNDEIVGVSPDTTLDNFKTKLVNGNDYTVSVKESNGTDKTSGNIATGNLVTVLDNNNNVVGVFEAVVTGDVNGDGTANAIDQRLIKAHRAEVKLLEGVYEEAADINHDGQVTAVDSRLLLYHRAEVEGYIL